MPESIRFTLDTLHRDILRTLDTLAVTGADVVLNDAPEPCRVRFGPYVPVWLVAAWLRLRTNDLADALRWLSARGLVETLRGRHFPLGNGARLQLPGGRIAFVERADVGGWTRYRATVGVPEGTTLPAGSLVYRGLWRADAGYPAVRATPAGLAALDSVRAERVAEPKTDLPALSESAAAVYEILMRLEPHKAMTGPRLIDALQERGVYIEQSTLTSRIVPELRPYGVENIPRKGYRLPPSKRPPA